MLHIWQSLPTQGGALEWRLPVRRAPHWTSQPGSSALAMLSHCCGLTREVRALVQTSMDPKHASDGGCQQITSWQLSRKMFLRGWPGWHVSGAAMCHIYHFFHLFSFTSLPFILQAYFSLPNTYLMLFLRLSSHATLPPATPSTPIRTPNEILMNLSVRSLG